MTEQELQGLRESLRPHSDNNVIVVSLLDELAENFSDFSEASIGSFLMMLVKRLAKNQEEVEDMLVIRRLTGNNG